MSYYDKASNLLETLITEQCDCNVEGDYLVILNPNLNNYPHRYQWLHRYYDNDLKCNVYVLDWEGHTGYIKIYVNADSKAFRKHITRKQRDEFDESYVVSMLNNMPDSRCASKLNHNQVIDFINKFNTQLKSKPKDIRKGQFAFNLLYEQYPKLANLLRGTENDPFYNDGMLSNFFNFIQQ